MLPKDLEIERVGGQLSGVTYEFPEVRGGVCTYCGVMNPNLPSTQQYKLCRHYAGKQLACSYCPQGKNADDVIEHSTLRVLLHPRDNRKLIVHCDSFNCLEKHKQEWQLATV